MALHVEGVRVAVTGRAICAQALGRRHIRFAISKNSHAPNASAAALRIAPLMAPSRLSPGKTVRSIGIALCLPWHVPATLHLRRLTIPLTIRSRRGIRLSGHPLFSGAPVRPSATADARALTPLVWVT